MKIRRYIGNNAQEAILKVKMDLGKEAVILSTKKIKKKGVLKFFSKPLTEVVAAIDDYNIKELKNNDKNKKIPNIINNHGINNGEIKENIKKDNFRVDNLENKVDKIETLLNKIYDEFANDSYKRGNNDKKHSNGKIMDMFLRNLVKNEVEEELAEKIIDIVQKKLKNNTSVNETASVLRQIIAGILGKPEPITLGDKNPKVVIFVGPTGVGKTTTLAKIAANYSLNQKKKVGLITADTYRIAAVEQLKTYAEILGMSVDVVYSSNEIKDTIKQNLDKDVILIDTAGRSYSDKGQFDELKEFINECNADETFLVLSATTSMLSCRDILKNYGFIKDYKLIFTKLDETPYAGIILNAKYLTKKSISYVTTGQSVPDDFEIANIETISKNLLGSMT
ncbi:MAG: flagellar biosynthesis protein FlhF [Clostridiales bacterium]